MPKRSRTILSWRKNGICEGTLEKYFFIHDSKDGGLSVIVIPINKQNINIIMFKPGWSCLDRYGSDPNHTDPSRLDSIWPDSTRSDLTVPCVGNGSKKTWDHLPPTSYQWKVFINQVFSRVMQWSHVSWQKLLFHLLFHLLPATLKWHCKEM